MMIRPEDGRATRRTVSRLALAVGLGLFAMTAAVAQKAPGAVGAVGRIQPLGGILSLSGSASQQIESVRVREGDKVRKGDVLVVFGDRSLRESERNAAAERLKSIEETAASRLRVVELERDSARNNLAVARADLQAIEGLDNLTVVPREKRGRQQQVTTAELALKLAEARLEDVRKSLDPERRQARSQLELAQLQVARSQLLAPVAGTIIDVPARAGTVMSGTLITLADTSVMQVVADVFEGDLARIAIGSKARVSNASLGQPMTGVVERIGRTVDPGSRLAKVTVKLDQVSPADRYLGMQVEVSIDGATAAK